MEIRHRILQINNSPNYELLKTKFQKLGCEYTFNENGSLSSIEFTFSEHAPYARKLLGFAKRKNIHFQSALHYEEDEILNAEWAIASVGEFQYPEEDYLENTFDTHNFCRRCGQGAVQNRPFRLKQDFTQKQAKFLGLHWVFDEIFIRPVVKNIFEAEGITGLDYREVINQKTGKPFENLLQLQMMTIPEEAWDTQKLFSVTCKPRNEEAFVKGIGWTNRNPDLPYCGRVKYHFPLTEPIVFNAKALSNLPDFAKSHEYFSSGGGATHFILVRNKVMKLIKEKNLRGLGFSRPVHLI